MKLICKKDHQEILSQLLKPYEDIDIVLVEQGLLYEGLSYQFQYEHIDECIQYLNELKNKQMLSGYKNERINLITINQIVYIEGLSRECYIHTMDEEYASKERLFELEEKLQGTSFIRISKSIIVNINYIDYLLPEANMRYGIYMKSKVKFTLSRKYMKDFKRKIQMR